MSEKAAWEIAWERDKYEVGRQMHLGWKRQKIANGFADHPFAWDPAKRGAYPVCRPGGCTLPKEQHHPDMIDWDKLPLGQQAINYEGGREGFRMGFEAGVASAARP